MKPPGGKHTERVCFTLTHIQHTLHYQCAGEREGERERERERERVRERVCVCVSVCVCV